MKTDRRIYKTDLAIRLGLAFKLERLAEELRRRGLSWDEIHQIANGPAPDEG